LTVYARNIVVLVIVGGAILSVMFLLVRPRVSRDAFFAIVLGFALVSMLAEAVYENHRNRTKR
jgi:hypothetical protein